MAAAVASRDGCARRLRPSVARRRVPGLRRGGRGQTSSSIPDGEKRYRRYVIKSAYMQKIRCKGKATSKAYALCISYRPHGPNVIVMRVAAAAVAIGLLGACGGFHALSLWKQMSVFMSACVKQTVLRGDTFNGLSYYGLQSMHRHHAGFSKEVHVTSFIQINQGARKPKRRNVLQGLVASGLSIGL